MGRKRLGDANKDQVVGFRIDEQESAELERKRALRGLSISAYFRTLMKEDE